MAAVSEATMIYNMRIVPSYVSSNGYYGYVPPINERNEHRSNYQQVQLNNNQPQHVKITNSCSNSIGVSSQYHQYNDQHYEYNNSSAMETDGDEKPYIEETQHCQNNHCVIPETADHLINASGSSGGGVHTLCRTDNNITHLMMTNQHGNRKRKDYDDPAFLVGCGTGQMKKLRQETVVTVNFTMV